MIKWSTTAFLIWSYRLGALTPSFQLESFPPLKSVPLPWLHGPLFSSTSFLWKKKSVLFPVSSGFRTFLGFRLDTRNLETNTGSWLVSVGLQGFRSWLWWTLKFLCLNDLWWAYLQSTNSGFFIRALAHSSSHSHIKCRKIIFPI